MNDSYGFISQWLGSGSINLFGDPFAGKDTQGKLLCEKLDAILISSGDILRHSSDNKELQAILTRGDIVPSALFEKIMLPYFNKRDLEGKPLILSEVGRAEGEQYSIIKVTNQTNHQLKLVVYLRLSDEEVWRRFESSKELGDRGNRDDDNAAVIQNRIEKFKSVVLPVIKYYEESGLLIEVDGEKSRNEVHNEIIDKIVRFIYSRASKSITNDSTR